MGYGISIPFDPTKTSQQSTKGLAKTNASFNNG